MPIQLACPKCQKKLRVKDELIGKKVRCPGCSSPLPVPGPLPPAREAVIPVATPFLGPPPAPAPIQPSAQEALEPILCSAAPTAPTGDPEPPYLIPRRRRLWPWLAAGGGGLVLVITVVLILVLSGGGGGTKVIRARNALINASRGERLHANNPDRDVVVIVRLPSVPTSTRDSRLFDNSYFMAGGQRRLFHFMSIPDNPSRPMWIAAVIPIEAKKVTLHLGDAPPQSFDLPETIVDEANAFD